MTGAIGYRKVDRIGWIELDRPEKRNALTADMWRALRARLRELDGTTDVAAVVVRGAGGAFSAGMDLAEMRSTDVELVSTLRTFGESSVAALAELPRPTFALVDGPCFGAGLALALACDVRVATTRSTFAVPALRHGFAYDPPLIRRLTRLIGPGSAGLLLYGAEQWDARQALERGLVDQCTDDASPLDEVLELLRGAGSSVVAPMTAAIRSAT